MREPEPSRLRLEHGHGRSTPSNITSLNNAPDPPFEHIATSAPSTWFDAHVAPQLLDAADDPLQHLRRRARVAVRHDAAVGRHRVLTTRFDRAAGHEVAALTLAAEAERLELADDLERERVVELAHVDVGRDRRPAVRKQSSAARRPTVPFTRSGRRWPPSSHVGGFLYAVPPLSPLPPRTYTGLPRHVGREIGAGEHDAASAFRRGRAVEEVERVGDHAAVEDVLRRERTTAAVDRAGVHVPVVADHRRDRRQRVGLGAVACACGGEPPARTRPR